MILKSVLRAVPIAALLGGTLFGSPPSAIDTAAREVSVDSHSEKAVAAELNELRSLMRQLNYDADQLNSLSRPGLHWQTHAFRLDQVKTHINRIGDQIEALRGMRSLAAPWQRDAIDDVIPIALDAADRTNAAIAHLNENRQQLWAPQYLDHLRTIAARSDQMQELLDTHLQIIEARNKIEMLQDKLANGTS